MHTNRSETLTHTHQHANAAVRSKQNAAKPFAFVLMAQHFCTSSIWPPPSSRRLLVWNWYKVDSSDMFVWCVANSTAVSKFEHAPLRTMAGHVSISSPLETNRMHTIMECIVFAHTQTLSLHVNAPAWQIYRNADEYVQTEIVESHRICHTCGRTTF